MKLNWKNLWKDVKPLEEPLNEIRKKNNLVLYGVQKYGYSEQELKNRREYQQRPDVKEKKRLAHKLYYQNPEARERNKLTMKKWRNQNRAKIRAYAQKRYYDNKKNGLCVYCASNKATEGFVSCDGCRKKDGTKKNI